MLKDSGRSKEELRFSGARQEPYLRLNVVSVLFVRCHGKDLVRTPEKGADLSLLDPFHDVLCPAKGAVRSKKPNVSHRARPPRRSNRCRPQISLRRERRPDARARFEKSAGQALLPRQHASRLSRRSTAPVRIVSRPLRPVPPHSKDRKSVV